MKLSGTKKSLPPFPQAGLRLTKRFETKPDKAVVYLFRDRLDFSRAPVSLMLDGQGRDAVPRYEYLDNH